MRMKPKKQKKAAAVDAEQPAQEQKAEANHLPWRARRHAHRKEAK